MIIQEGKFYKARNGNKIGPMEKSGDGWIGRDNDDPARRSYDVDGYWYKAMGDSEHDIFCPWHDSPIQTQTKLVLVPGVYGAIKVQEYTNDLLRIDLESCVLDANDLDQLSSVASQLAEFLRGEKG